MTQQRLNVCHDAFVSSHENSPRRTEVYPTTLIRPICGICARSFWLGRSGKYPSFTCLGGKHGKDGCAFKGYKSAAIIDNSILEYLKEHIFTHCYIHQLVAKANSYLLAETAKPKPDVASIEAQVRSLSRKIKRLGDIIEDEASEDVSELLSRLKTNERERKRLRAELRNDQAQSDIPPELDFAMVVRHLDDLRGLLKQDIAQAAPVLASITGPVVVNQKHEPGKKKPTWIASFTVNMVPVMLELARKTNCPTAETLEYLIGRSWTMPTNVECVLGKSTRSPITAEMEARIAEMIRSGESNNAIAKTVGCCVKTVSRRRKNLVEPQTK